MSAGIPRLPVVESENSLPAPGSDESCWSTLAADSLSDYYSSITDSRCNFNQESGVLDRSLLWNSAAAQFSGVAADRIDTGLAPLQCDSLTATTSVNQSASSSSSEDAQEKSNDSSGGGLKAATATSSKVKKKTQKKMRQARFAFMTKSEVDHLEDGYRWRKYGQKAVKNSPFPRSYYRCTNSKCTVKKRVERSWEDPTIVITTYEGQHCHHTNGFPRCGFIPYEDVFSNQLALPPPRFYYPSQQIHSTTQSSNRLQIPGETTREDLSVLQVCDQSSVHTNMYQGLLEDIVSPRTRT